MSEEPIVDEIQRLKRQKHAVILAHNYERGEIQDIADHVGDSFELSRIAADIDCRVLVFCGVRFMAETAKILSPQKTVIIPRPDAGCAMADMFTLEMLSELRRDHHDAAVLSYVNTSAAIKAESNVCCTSANAVAVAEGIEADKVIFVPDRNLAHFVAKHVDKEIIPCAKAYCYVHDNITAEQVQDAMQQYPEAQVLVHPECRPEVIALAHHALSTGGMMREARASTANSFIVVTEVGILHRLRKDNPGKKFYAVHPEPVCRDMKLTRMQDVLRSLREGTYEVRLDDRVMRDARHALDEMLHTKVSSSDRVG